MVHYIIESLYCVSVMLPSNQCMVLNMEHKIPPTMTSSSSLSLLSRYIDYTTILASPDAAGIYLDISTFKSLCSLFSIVL